MQKQKRNCQKCGLSEHMTRRRDNVIDVRFRVCYKCNETLEHVTHSNNDFLYLEENEKLNEKKAE